MRKEGSRRMTDSRSVRTVDLWEASSASRLSAVASGFGSRDSKTIFVASGREENVCCQRVRDTTHRP